MKNRPTELQWLSLCDRVRALAQMRYRVFDLYMDGGFLFIEAKSCDNDFHIIVFILNPEGDFLP